jgi:hypothetical protein
MSDRVERHRLGQQRHLRFAVLPTNHTDDYTASLVRLGTWATQPRSAFLTHTNPTDYGTLDTPPRLRQSVAVPEACRLLAT